MPCGEFGMAGISSFAQLAGTSNSLSFGTVRSILVSSVITPDGKRIISGSYDSTIKLWDAQTGQCLMTMANLPDNETASWSETEPKLLSASPNA